VSKAVVVDHLFQVQARSAAPSATDHLTIAVVTGVGRGRTLLSAFDDALRRCGVHNYNLIPLSSVIPPSAVVVRRDRYATPPDEHGHRLYVVKADVRSDQPGQVIAAGIGWYQWGDGRGVFVEHEAVGLRREAVEADLDCRIRQSLQDLCAFREIPCDLRSIGCAVSLAEVSDLPTTALVLGVYRSEGWT
jgi:arginine decarboxylase